MKAIKTVSLLHVLWNTNASQNILNTCEILLLTIRCFDDVCLIISTSPLLANSV